VRRDAEQTGGGGKEAGGVHLFREPSKEKRWVTAEPARPKQRPRNRKRMQQQLPNRRRKQQKDGGRGQGNRKHQAAEEAALDRKRTMAQAKGGH